MSENLIFDIGMHNGNDSKFYLEKGFKVVAIEANPYCCRFARKELGKYIDNGQLIIEECAISNFIGHTGFIINHTHTDWGTLDKKWNSKYKSDTEQINVRCTTLNALLDKYPTDIYYMKIDIEGYDIECIKQLLKQYHKLINVPKYISVELLTYNNLSEKHSSLNIFQYLRKLGYTKYQIVDQSKNHLVKCPKPSLEGEYVDFKFDGYSSGLFGKELPDNWVNMDEAIEYYHGYFYNMTHPNSWFDLHCTY